MQRIDEYFRNIQDIISSSKIVASSNIEYVKVLDAEGYVRGALTLIDGSELRIMEYTIIRWGLAGSLETEGAMREGWIKVLEVVDKWKAREMALARKVHLANAETVQLAREVKATILLANEEEVRELAAEFGLEVRGCLGLLAEAARRKLISVKEAKQDARRLMEAGYRISEEVLREFYAILESEESR